MNKIYYKNLGLILKSYILVNLFGVLFAFASEFELKNQDLSSNKFNLEVSKNDVPFNKYDSPTSQFDKFFGLTTNYNNNDQINYQDLSITIDSKNLRSLYQNKMDRMTKKTNKYETFFYTEKL